MAFTDKGSITNQLTVAWATENPVKAKLTNPAGTRIVFSTDLADGVEGTLALTFATGIFSTGLIWPSNVRWDRNGQAPNPEPWQPVARDTTGVVPADAGTAVFKFLRDNGANVYYARMVMTGARAL